MLPFDAGGRGTPAYDLERIQQLVGQGSISRDITMTAVEGARPLGITPDQIVEAVLMLTPQCFYKCMEAERLPGLWQDVYHLRYGSVDLYIKLQISARGRGVVVQFKKR